jgi:hypothetical protein
MPASAGDIKTNAFLLMDAEMYTGDVFAAARDRLSTQGGMALHKMMRLVTMGFGR